ncbi:MAG: hypothetical protein ACR2PT_05080 [Endozoicomonas sp.]
MKTLTHIVLSVLLTAPVALADSFRRQVVHSAEDYLKVQALRISQKFDASHFKVKAYPPPKRMKESPCPLALRVSPVKAPEPGMQQLKVVCPTGSQWSLYVKGQIAIFLPVLVSQETIASGTTPTAMQMTWRDHDIGKLIDGHYTDPLQLSRLKARVRIKPGTVLTPAMFSLEKTTPLEQDAFSKISARHQ